MPPRIRGDEERAPYRPSLRKGLGRWPPEAPAWLEAPRRPATPRQNEPGERAAARPRWPRKRPQGPGTTPHREVCQAWLGWPNRDRDVPGRHVFNGSAVESHLPQHRLELLRAAKRPVAGEAHVEPPLALVRRIPEDHEAFAGRHHAAPRLLSPSSTAATRTAAARTAPALIHSISGFGRAPKATPTAVPMGAPMRRGARSPRPTTP